MLVKDEKLLMEKVTVAVGLLIDNKLDRWTDREISELTGVPPTRLTEYKNFEKYSRRITVAHLVKFIGSGLITMENIVSEIKELTDEEKKHLRDMNFYENTELRKDIVENKNLGVDPAELHRLINDLQKSGVDVMTLLRNQKQ